MVPISQLFAWCPFLSPELYFSTLVSLKSLKSIPFPDIDPSPKHSIRSLVQPPNALPLVSSWWAPNRYWCLGLLLPRRRTLYFPLWNCMRFLSVHLFTLLLVSWSRHKFQEVLLFMNCTTLQHTMWTFFVMRSKGPVSLKSLGTGQSLKIGVGRKKLQGQWE